MRPLSSIVLLAAAYLALTSCRGSDEGAVVPSPAGGVVPVSPAAEAPPAIPPLDPGLAARVGDALDGLAGESEARIRRLAPVFLGELEGDRLPGPLREALRQVGSVPPDQRSVHLARALGARQLRPFWANRLCDGDLGVLDAIGAAAAEAKTEALLARCRLVEADLLSREEALGSGALELLLAHVVWVFLEPGDEIAPVERRLLRGTALGDVAPSPRAGAP